MFFPSGVVAAAGVFEYDGAIVADNIPSISSVGFLRGEAGALTPDARYRNRQIMRMSRSPASVFTFELDQDAPNTDAVFTTLEIATTIGVQTLTRASATYINTAGVGRWSWTVGGATFTVGLTYSLKVS